ncbi:MAG: universal stress protein [Rudaea sp.]
MRNILALADNYVTWTRSMRYAGELASSLNSTLTGVFIAEPFIPMPSMALPIFPEVYSFTATLVTEARAAEPGFLRQATSLGIKMAQWLVMEGGLAASLAYAANWHDLLVLGSGKQSPWTIPGTLGHIILTCGRPTILVADSCARKAALTTIAIAWNGSPESMRAVHAAVPLLRRASSIVLIDGEHPQPYSAIQCMPAFNIEEWLAQHNIRCSKIPLAAQGDVAWTELLRVARETNADLLVMGAYGHSRFSEWVLGGATRYMLEQEDLPVFMHH